MEPEEVPLRDYFTTSPVAVDIGGSLGKMVYWRPSNPPALPDYILKEGESFTIASSKLPLKADPTLSIDSPLLGGKLKFLKIPYQNTSDFIEFARAQQLHAVYGPGKLKTIHATGGGINLAH